MRHQNSLPLIALGIGIAGLPLVAQDGTSIADISSDLRTSRFVAPGQIVRLSFRNVDEGAWSFGGRIATKIPIPTSVFGMSFTIRQSGSTEEIPVPLISTAGGGPNCGGLISIIPAPNLVPCTPRNNDLGLVIQIPYRIKTNRPGLGNLGNEAISAPCGPLQSPSNGDCLYDINDAVLTVRQGSRTGNFRVTPVVDQVQIIKSCQPVGNLNYASSFCTPAIFHADGKAVSSTNPARASEVVTVYAYGLGAPDTFFDDAMGTPADGVPVSRPISISFSGGVTPAAVRPEYVGLTPNSAGLYQLNVRMPELLADFPACGADRDFNLTISVKGTASVDSASFCIAR